MNLIAGVIIAGFCVFLQLYATQPLLALLRERFHASEAAVSLTVSAGTLAVAIFSPFVGFIADTLGRKRVIVPCLFALSLCTLGCALADSLSQLVVFRFLAGVFTPGVIAVVLSYISEETPGGKVSFVTSLYVTGTVLGGLTGRLSSAFIADHSSWRASFTALALLTFAGAVLTMFSLPRSTGFRTRAHLRDALPAMLIHMKNGRLRATYLTGFNALFCHVGLFTYANFHLSKPPFSLSTSALGLVFLVYALGIVITPLAGRMIDRVGHRNGATAAIGFLAAGLLLTLIPGIAVFVLGLAVASAGVFIMQSAASSHVSQSAGKARSAATGLYVSFYYFGGSVGATLLAAAWKFGGWGAIIASMILVQCVSLAAVRMFFADRPARPSSPVVLD